MTFTSTVLTSTVIPYDCFLGDHNIPSGELTFPLHKALLKMIFLFPRWDRLVPWRGSYDQVEYLFDPSILSLHIDKRYVSNDTSNLKKTRGAASLIFTYFHKGHLPSLCASFRPLLGINATWRSQLKSQRTI